MDIQNLPALPPPPGVKSQFDHPSDTMVTLLTIVNAIFVGLAFLTVVVRVGTRSFISRQTLGWDDGMSVLAMLGSIVHTTICLDNVEIGYGLHFWDIRAISLDESKIQRLSSVDIVYGTVIYMVKLSILFLYYRLFSVYDSSRKLVYGGIFLCTLITIPYVGVAIARIVVCSGFKIVLEHLTFCYTKPVNTTIVTFGVFNTISDFYILAIPLNRVLKLHVTRKARLGLLAVFLVAFAACIVSVVCLIFVSIYFDNSDVFYRGATTSVFSAVELNLAIICSCSITFPAFYRRSKETIQPVLWIIFRKSQSRITRSKSGKRDSTKFVVHNKAIDNGKQEKDDSPKGTPKEQRPYVSLNMTRATIDMGSQI